MSGNIPPMEGSRSPVKIGNGDGDFTIDAQLLGERFGIAEAEMRAFLTKKMVHSLVERGVDADEGTWRLTLRLGNRAWRGIVSRDGALIEESMSYTPSGRNTRR